MPLKVTVSGAFSTGKTTIVSQAAAHLRSSGLDVLIVDDVARDAPVSLNREQTPNASAWLIGTQIARESEAMRSAVDLVLCDRAIFDVLSHTLMIRPQSDSDRNLLRNIWEVGSAWTPSYDQVLTTRINADIPPVDDSLRIADPHYREALDQSLNDVFSRLGSERDDLPSDPVHALEAAIARIQSLF